MEVQSCKLKKCGKDRWPVFELCTALWPLRAAPQGPLINFTPPHTHLEPWTGCEIIDNNLESPGSFDKLVNAELQYLHVEPFWHNAYTLG
ncbi:predicted protein [Sclerotinia sclerotiorum 1980 UF-70]|uniref:Uncharacterized protein n=1 Tax=Sclerotinia sclerotiorum (strain ATCC 18683 / 1980 / Ss-1) TaxID=665079 RepID=A7EC47_SCLS1|nr:predicted protein [Sclerotinia sclerotiorum 1980 UF-70]EDO00026.1 predicted protein [Sclerotinia sclerotiorum 1980 UF-70]